MTFSAKEMWLLCGSRVLLSLIFTAYSGILPFSSEEWNLNATAAASIQSGWHVSYLVSLFAAGFLADRFGAKRVFCVAGVLAAAATMLFALLATGYWSALILYSLAGLCSGGTYTSGIALVHKHTVAAMRGRHMGYFLAAGSVGYALGLYVIGKSVEFASWHGGLHAIAAGALVGAILAVVSLSRVDDVDVRRAASRSSWFDALAQTLSDRKSMVLNWTYMFHCWELFALWAWMPAFLVLLLKDSSSSGTGYGIVLASAAHLLSVAGSIAGGASSDRYGRYRAIGIAGAMSALASFVAGSTLFWPLWAAFAFFAVYNIAAIADSPVYSTALAEKVPPDRLGVAFSVRSVMGFGAGAMSPFVFGAILDNATIAAHYGREGSWIAAWSSLGVVSILVPVLIFAAQRKEARCTKSMET